MSFGGVVGGRLAVHGSLCLGFALRGLNVSCEDSVSRFGAQCFCWRLWILQLHSGAGYQIMQRADFATALMITDSEEQAAEHKILTSAGIATVFSSGELFLSSLLLKSGSPSFGDFILCNCLHWHFFCLIGFVISVSCLPLLISSWFHLLRTRQGQAR